MNIKRSKNILNFNEKPKKNIKKQKKIIPPRKDISLKYNLYTAFIDFSNDFDMISLVTNSF